MATREAAVFDQPVAATSRLPSQYPEIPKKLAQIDPSFRLYHDGTERLYRRVRESLRESTDQIAAGTNKLALDTTASISAVSGGLSASIATETAARIAGDTALATSITTLEAEVDTNYSTLSAAITTEATTRASADSAEASTRASADATLTTSIGTVSAAVTAETSARVTADGHLEGKYTLKVIAANVVTGMNITSASGGGTDVSSVIFQASEFKIYNGTSGDAIFAASGGAVLLASTLKVSTSGKVFIGTGTYGNSNTSFYVDSAGQFSLKDKLTWDGATLTIDGGGTFSGALSAATGTFAGALSAATGTFAGSLSAATGTFSGSLSAATGTFSGTVDIGSGVARTVVDTSKLTYGYGQTSRIELSNTYGSDANAQAISIFRSSVERITLSSQSPGGVVHSYLIVTGDGSKSTWIDSHFIEFDLDSNAKLTRPSSGLILASGSFKVSDDIYVTDKLYLGAGLSYFYESSAGIIRSDQNLSVAGYITAEGGMNCNGGHLTLGTGGRNLVLTDGVVTKSTPGGWGPYLWDGSNTIELRYNAGQVEARVAGSTVIVLG